MSDFPLPWQRGTSADTSDSGDPPPFVPAPLLWARRGIPAQEAVHTYAQDQSADLGIEYIYRIQSQYPWKITSITPAIVISTISEGRP